MKRNSLRFKIRKRLCWLLGHRYRAIWFNPVVRGGKVIGQAGVADTEYGCVYCSHKEPNTHMMAVEDIDWSATPHRTYPPVNNVYRRER